MLHYYKIIIILYVIGPLSSEIAAIISEKLTKLSAEGAKVVYNEFSEESCSDKEWNNWRVFMRMILDWESGTKNKREFLLKLISIAKRLTNKSDADKLTELASSYIKGQCVSLYYLRLHA